ncbi:MAG TPA: nucleoside-diphosphate sugar epimerase/dehydratase [Acidimicrobiales bacterium]|nr:nucleoside-diphosphate sugar epimerase/dehydratase [Acidimicrobiales bacterium]
MGVADAAIWVVCITGANMLRYQFGARQSLTPRLFVIVAMAVVTQIAFGTITQLYRARWRVGSFEEVLALAQTVLVVTVGVTAVNLVPSQHVVPASATIGGGALALVAAAGLRVGWRLNWERHRQPADLAERAVIFGAGDAGAQVVDALLADPASSYVPVAILDDDPAKANLRLRRLKVSGTRHDLADTAARHGADTVIIAIPSAGSQLVRDISDLAIAAGLTAKVLPTLSQMLASSVSADDIRPVTHADLLGRRVVDTEVDLIAGYLTGRRVLVTGAGGSIGSELCRQIHRHAPERLVMVDRDESGLHQVQLSIEGRALLDDRALAVCDIRDAAAVGAVFAEHRPEVVFHAAALKHLPLLEMWPTEAVKTNVEGTNNVLAACAAHGVERFVNISTDKAANPTSVLGYTKRLGERLTAGTAERACGSYLSVRFGNVLGSRGSVLTTFQAQIAAGGPVTVTHPDVTRYFMTVEEAVELVVQAGAVGRDGEVLVLDMGVPVRIAEVAERMVLASRRPIDIVYTGLRPGEKLHEQLFDDGEEGERRAHPLISHVRVPPLHPEDLAGLGHVHSPASTKNRLASLCRIPLDWRHDAYSEGAVPALIDLTRAVEPAGGL